MKRGKKAQLMSLPFGMIFSILIIIFFLVAAFIAIKYFLDIEKCSKVGLFTKYLQDDITNAWRNSGSNLTFKFKENPLPSGMKAVCFANLSLAFKGNSSDRVIFLDINRGDRNNNFFFYPRNKACDTPAVVISHVNMSILATKNPYCIIISDKSEIKISKGFYDILVRVT